MILTKRDFFMGAAAMAAVATAKLLIGSSPTSVYLGTALTFVIIGLYLGMTETDGDLITGEDL